MKSIECPKCSGTGRLPDQAAIGAAMRAKREAAGLNQQDVADRLGITQGFVSVLESGLCEWSQITKRDYEKAIQRKPATRRKAA